MEQYVPTDPELTMKLRRAGYSIDDIYANHRRQILFVISGPNVTGLAMFDWEADDLANGRTTVEEILRRKESQDHERSPE